MQNGWPKFDTSIDCTLDMMKDCTYAGDYASQKAGNVISIMITTTFSAGGFDHCS